MKRSNRKGIRQHKQTQKANVKPVASLVEKVDWNEAGVVARKEAQNVMKVTKAAFRNILKAVKSLKQAA
jgi:hypothetical protein